MTPKGGTELLQENLNRYVDAHLLSRVNLITSICHPGLLVNNKPNVMWQHLSYDQPNVQTMKNSIFVARMHQYIYVSDWQLNKYAEHFDIPLDKSMVIRNAIEPIEYIPRPTTSKLKLIYTSTPWRGLEVLLDVMELLNRDDIELDVYSSTIIYGKHFMPTAYDRVFDRCRRTKNVNYKGYALNKAVRKAVQSAHIFTYPSIFEETSCVSAIEAGAAGCKIVTTNFGALPETCGNYASYVEYTSDRPTLVNSYAELLNNEIDNYWNNSLKDQSDFFNSKYSWNTRSQEWETLFKNLCNE